MNLTSYDQLADKVNRVEFTGRLDLRALPNITANYHIIQIVNRIIEILQYNLVQYFSSPPNHGLWSQKYDEGVELHFTS